MLEFRPHHFLCTLGFEGKGYSAEFVANFQRIADELRGDPRGDEVEIRVTVQSDSICAPCPSRRERGCASGEKIASLDAAHAEVLGLRDGDVLTWGEAKALIAEKFTQAKFDSSCAPCSWKALGVCEKALARLKENQRPLSRKTVTRSFATMTLGFALFAFAGATIARAENAPVDTLEQNLFKNRKSKKVSALKKAYDSFKAGRFDQAIHESASLLGDPRVADYAHWITALSYRAQANNALDNSRPKDAVAAAKKGLNQLLQIQLNDPYSPLIRQLGKEFALTEITAGRGEKAGGNSKEAARLFENAFERVAANGSAASGVADIRPEALSAFSEVCNEKNEPSDLCEPWLKKLSALYPRNSAELKAIARHYDDADERTRAPFYPRTTQSYKAPDLDQTAFDAAMAKYFDEKYGDAAKLFKQFLDEFPRSAYRFRARYWLGQAFTHDQKHDEAQKTYEELLRDSPLTYYGLLAALAAGKPVDSAIDGSLPNGQSRDPSLTPEELRRVERAEYLVTAGASDLAAFELREFKPRAQLSSEFLMYLCLLNSQVKNYNTSFTFLGELIQRGFPGVSSSYGLRMIFPLIYTDEIQAAATENGLDPVLVLSLVKQESAFDQRAISGSGALGLMQLMPATAVDNQPDVIRADLSTAKVNVRVGTAYLKRLLNRFNGNIVLALAGYNAGPNAADRWLRDSGKRGMLEFIESIPYRETREYVSSIIRNYYWYTKKLTGEPPKSLTYFWNLYGPPEKPPTLTNITNVTATQ